MDLAEIKGRLDNWFSRIVDYATEIETKNQELDNDFYGHVIINFSNYAQSQHQLAEVLKWLDSKDGKKAFDYDLYAQKIYEYYQEISWDNPEHLISKVRFALGFNTRRKNG